MSRLDRLNVGGMKLSSLIVLFFALLSRAAWGSEVLIPDGKGLWYVQNSSVVYLDAMLVPHPVARTESIRRPFRADILAAGPTDGTVWERKQDSVVLLHSDGKFTEYSFKGASVKDTVSVGASCWVELTDGRIARVENGVTTYFRNPLPAAAEKIYRDPPSGGIILYSGPLPDSKLSLLRLSKAGDVSDITLPSALDRTSALYAPPLVEERPDGRVMALFAYRKKPTTAVLLGGGKPTVVVQDYSLCASSNLVSSGDAFIFSTCILTKPGLIEISDDGSSKELTWPKKYPPNKISLSVTGSTVLGLMEDNESTRLFRLDARRLRIYDLAEHPLLGKIVFGDDDYAYISHRGSNILDILDRNWNALCFSIA
jgi:hypothetical protein